MNTTNEGEFKKRLFENRDVINAKPLMVAMEDWLDEAHKDYPQVSQKWVPTKGKRVDWKTLCLQMEQKIIEFENFGKRWFGDKK